jgi:PAS domain S-box-containing protein
LLADDNADMREYLRRALAERKYEVRAVADGESALKAARAQSFDLVLTDVMMPKLDGFGLLKALRADESTRSMPVILLSARAGEEARVEGLEAGADDYLVKPFSARELAARVESHLNLASLRREQEARTAADLKAIERLREVGNLCARAGHDFEQCLDEIVVAAVAVTGADMGNIQLLDDESGALRIAAQRGFAESFLNFFACVSEAEALACGVSLRSAGRVIVEDVTRSEIFAGRPSLYALLEAGVSAAQSTPLVSSSGRVFGLISTHFRTPHRPAERDLRLIDLLARQTADYLERIQAEEALRARESQLQTLFDAAPLGIYVVDADFRIRQVNPTALPVFGDIPGLIGRDFDEVIHILWPKVYADEVVRRFRHTLKTGEPYIMPERIEERLDRGVKEYYEWQIHRIPLPGANPDKAYGVVCYFRDISDQVLARQKIAESEERFRALTTASSDVVYSMSPDWSEMRYLNGRDFIPDTEKPSMTWLEKYIHLEDQPHVTAAIQEAIRAKSVFELEHRVIRVDGTLGWAFSRAIPLLDACGEIVDWIGAASDVTVRKRSEVERAELLAREQAARAAAEDANRLKDEFLATLSHELRNPLNSIVGNAEILLLSPEANGTSPVRRAAEVIHRNAVSQAQLINDLLDLSRLQTGKMTIDKRPIALAPVIGDAVEAVRAEVAAKKLELDVALPEKSPVVNADPVRMKQIVWNLVNNAVKFTPKGGQVSVRLSQDGDGAKIVVEDTGQGVEAAFLPHIFEMFRQADGGTKRSHGGMGIGLSLVSQIVELHGGEVQAFSEGQGRGARFTVKLPLHTAVGVERTAPSRTTADELADVRILVIDDSEDSIAILHALLTGKGAKVDTALNGEEGLRLTEDMDFDLIISDISMPIMDGYEFLQKLREARPKYASVPSIALTGFGREEDAERARQVGFTTHLTKPLDFKNLLRLAQVMLRK